MSTDVTEDEELYLARATSFFGVYILYNLNPKFKGSIYIGFTVNPERRIRQHNREIKGGASRTGRNRGPWDMVLITHGFSTKLAALQFEWAWQNPQVSRRLSHLPKKQSKENVFSYRLRILSEMLNTGPWNRLPLTIQWLKQEYYQHFPVNKPPPTHMPIAYGEIKTVKKRIDPQPETHVTKHTLSENVECGSGSQLCNICYGDNGNDLNNPMLHCIVEVCDFIGHMKCLSDEFLKQTMDKGKYLMPISGRCPLCKEDVFWGDVIKQKKYSLNDLDFDDSQEEEIHETQESYGIQDVPSDEEEFQ